MLKSSAYRVVQAVVTLWVTSVLVWALLLLAPGDPARTVLAARGVANPPPALIAATRRQLGLSGPVVPRYWHWLERALHGDFGTSWQTGQPVMQEFAARLPATARLTVTAMLIAVGLALLLGLASAAAAGSWIDRVIRMITVLMVVTPGFVIGLFVLDILVVHLNLGQVVSNGQWSTVGWPAATLAIGSAGFWARVLRVSLLEATSASYLLVSQARGTSAARRLFVHVLPNAAATFLTVVGIGAAALLGGAPITEIVYSWPGVGQYTVQAIGARDLPVVVTYTMLAVAAYIVASLLIDLALAAIDPRLRHQPAIRLRPRSLRAEA
ncbi:MAG TPA: ABC transporter permease [Trebonia sp.]|nr:ABC transporter permease [Trebonia sp.]